MGTRIDRQQTVTLPPAKQTFDYQNEQQFRRLVEEALNRTAARPIADMPWLDVSTGLYRARGDGVTDDGLAIQAAIDEAAAEVADTGSDETVGGRIVYLPPGHYSVDTIVLRYGVHLVGAGQQATKIVPRSGTTDPVVTLDEGIVAYAGIHHLSIVGNGNSGQRAIYFKAQPIEQADTVQGGFWNSELSHLTITGFDAESIWLHAGGDSFDGPHQFITFDQVECVSDSLTTATLRLSGEVNQVKMLGPCRFDGPGKGLGTVNVLIERTVDDDGVNNGNVAPRSIHFGLSSIQSNTRGVTIETALDVSFAGTHFEELDEGIYCDLSAKNVQVHNCYCGNVGHTGPLTGWFLKMVSGSAKAGNNFFSASDPLLATDTHYVLTGGSIEFFGTDTDSTGIRTSGITLQINPTASIDVRGHDTVLINGGSATAVETIVCDLPVGRTLKLRAHTGTVIFTSAGNITFDGTLFVSPLTIPQDSVLTLVRVDLGGEWFIVAGQENGSGSAIAVSTAASTADSKAVSAGSGASVADSKGVSSGTRASIADSKAVSVSVNTSVADSKATLAASNAGVAQAAASTADSKAVSSGLRASNAQSRLLSAGF